VEKSNIFEDDELVWHPPASRVEALKRRAAEDPRKHPTVALKALSRINIVWNLVLALLLALVLILCFFGLETLKSLTYPNSGMQINGLEAAIGLAVIVVFILGHRMTERRRRLYARAGELVLRTEPLRVKLRGGYESHGVGTGKITAEGFGLPGGLETAAEVPGVVYYICIEGFDGSADRKKWRIKYDLTNRSVLTDYPQIWSRQGMLAEVYLDPETKMPVGIFVDDNVYWLL